MFQQNAVHIQQIYIYTHKKDVDMCYIYMYSSHTRDMT